MSADPTAALALTSARLILLEARFRRMAEVRRESADLNRQAGRLNVGDEQDMRAKVYERCAAEVGKVTAGEDPPPVGEEWPGTETDTLDGAEQSKAT